MAAWAQWATDKPPKRPADGGRASFGGCSQDEYKMSTHRFTIGQSVRLKSRFGLSPDTAETYRITGILPARDNSPQYRVRNDEERYERMTTEDSLEEVEAAPALVLGGTVSK